MPVNLSIKDVPDDWADLLRARARWNHRSLQGELMAMVETHVRARPFRAMALLDEVRKLGLVTANDSTEIIREDRDSR